MLWSATSDELLAMCMGLFQAVLAERFMQHHRHKRDWGLAWLALAYLCGAIVNLNGHWLLSVESELRSALYLIVALVAGFGSLAAMVVGVRTYVGRTRPSALATFCLSLVAVIAATAVLFKAGITAAGDIVCSVMFIYLATVAARASRREHATGHLLVTSVLLLQPLTMLVLLILHADATRARYYASVPYTLVGVAMLSLSLSRMRLSLESELAARQRAEEKLKQLNESLEQLIESRTQDLRTMVSDLESFNRTVSHDLRGPLGGLASLMSYAKQALDAGQTEKVRRWLDTMESQTTQLLGLVNELLMLARASTAELILVPLQLDTVLRDAMRTLGLSHLEPSVDVVHAPALPEVRGDATLLRQVFINLVGNALKFTRGSPEPRVDISARKSGDEWIVSVKDNGVGFDPSKAGELFQPFRRLHADVEGMGVGLATVSRIIRRHGGRVWAESQPGQGATFYFTLPCDAE